MQTDGVAYKNTFDAATKIYQRAGLLEGLYVSKSNCACIVDLVHFFLFCALFLIPSFLYLHSFTTSL